MFATVLEHADRQECCAAVSPATRPQGRGREGVSLQRPIPWQGIALRGTAAKRARMIVHDPGFSTSTDLRSAAAGHLPFPERCGAPSRMRGRGPALEDMSAHEPGRGLCSTSPQRARRKAPPTPTAPNGRGTNRPQSGRIVAAIGYDTIVAGSESAHHRSTSRSTS